MTLIFIGTLKRYLSDHPDLAVLLPEAHFFCGKHEYEKGLKRYECEHFSG